MMHGWMAFKLKLGAIYTKLTTMWHCLRVVTSEGFQKVIVNLDSEIVMGPLLNEVITSSPYTQLVDYCKVIMA